MKRFLMPVLVLTTLAGCQTIDPYTQTQKTGNAASGAGVGALAGALLGAAVSKGNRAEGALIGAAVGGAVGGGVGYYMDQQEMLLRQELEGTGVRVERIGDEIRLIMPSNITFATDSERFDQRFYPVLDSVGKVLAEFEETSIYVDGYTDSTGSFEYNQMLSERRATAVSNYLRQVGVSPIRINTRGFGERSPVASNDTEAGRSANRRVEIWIRGTRR